MWPDQMCEEKEWSDMRWGGQIGTTFVKGLKDRNLELRVL